MEPVERLIRAARQRIRLSHSLDVVCTALTALAAMALILAILDRLPAAPFVSWGVIVIGMALMTMVVFLLTWIVNRPSDLAVATVVDDRLKLDDRFATAIHMERRGDPIARAVVQDAVATASDPRTGEQVRRTFRPGAPGGWWMAPLLLAMALIVGFFGQADLFAASSPEVGEGDVSMQIASDEAAVTSLIEAQPQLKEAMSDLLEELEAEQAERADELLTPEQLQREQLKRMTELERSLDELVTGERGQEMDALRSALEQLDQSDAGDVQALSDALSQGDFDKAMDALEQMRSTLDDPALTDEERAKMASDLEELAKQLEELAADQQALKEALKQAGLDPQLANDAQALEAAINQAEQLTQEQREQLLEQIQAQQAAHEACRKMGEACSEMASQCQQGKPGQQSGRQMSEQLSQLEQAKEMLREAQAAQSECQSQCQKLGMGLPSNSQSQCEGMNPGPGMLGRGGAEMAAAEDETNAASQQAGGAADAGPVIGQTKTDGPVRTGTSSKSFDEIVSSSADGFDDAFNESQLPRKYHELIKHYFGSANEVTDAVEYDAAKAEDDDATTEPASEQPEDEEASPEEE
ncbi:MAG: hypothetical protein MK095_03915 [Phycisphaerales bacterium]|nr:hypothetical protein [Phycisphaerales bacterium]